MHPPKRMQVVCDDIGVGILNLLHKIITLPSSVASRYDFCK